MPTDNLKKWTEDPNYKKPGYGKEIPQTKKFKSDLDAWLTGNVVEPMANAGYPNLGAGIATVPSTLAEFLLPENTAELAPGMAGVGKLGRKGKAIYKKVDEQLSKLSTSELFYLRDKLHKASQLLFNKDRERSNRYIELSKDITDYIMSSDKFLSTGFQPKWSKDAQKNYANRFKDISKSDYLPDNYEKLRRSKEWGERVNKEGYEKLDILDRSLFGKQKEPYLRPKGYAKQPKMVKPELPQSPIQTREQYDEMLRGKNPGQEYFSGMTDEFNNAQMKEDDFDLIKQLIDKSWKAK